MKSPFETEEDVKKYFKEYWDGFFIPHNAEGVKLNYEMILDRGLIVYGGYEDVPDGVQRYNKGSNEYLYLGQNLNGGYITNLAYPESTMRNFKMYKDIKNLDNESIHLSAKPKLTIWNKPKYVENLLGAKNPDEYGKLVTRIWAKNIKNRLPELHNGEDFHTFMTTDEILSSFAIQIPPTARTYGLATAWFNNNGRDTFRTFIIDKVPRIDFIAETFEFDEETKTVTLGYKVKGIEQQEDNLIFALLFDLENETKKMESNYSNSPELIITKEDKGITKFIHLTNVLFKRQPLDENIRYVTFDLSPYLKEEREKAIEVRAIVNPMKDFNEEILDNNEIKGIIPSTSKDINFILDAVASRDVHYEGDGDKKLQFILSLVNTHEKLDTVVKLYKGSTEIDSINVNIAGGDSKFIELEISESELSKGENELYAVVNSDRNLSVATPINTEVNLTDNKANVELEYIEEYVEYSNDCDFNRSGGSASYEIYRCKKDEDGNVHCWCDSRSHSLKRVAEVEYIEYSMYSDSWSANKEAQEFGIDAGVDTAIDEEGHDAKDELMSMVGINPLRQSIRAGKGIGIKSKIKITGSIETKDGYKDSIIHNFIDYFKSNGVLVSGKNDTSGAKDVRNSNGEYTQKMICDDDESISLNITHQGYRTYGSSKCKTVDVYITDFEAEIPLIIDKAHGNIAVIGSEDNHPVPNENKWFIYLNEQNDTYGLKIVTRVDPSKLGASGNVTSCEISPDNFKFTVYGTIFDDINIDVDDGGEEGFWDN